MQRMVMAIIDTDTRVLAAVMMLCGVIAFIAVIFCDVLPSRRRG